MKYILIILGSALIGLQLGGVIGAYNTNVYLREHWPQDLSYILPLQLPVVCDPSTCDMGAAINNAYNSIGLSRSLSIAFKYRPLDLELPAGNFNITTPIHLQARTTIVGSGTSLYGQPILTMDGGGEEGLDDVGFIGAPLILVTAHTDAVIDDNNFYASPKYLPLPITFPSSTKETAHK